MLGDLRDTGENLVVGVVKELVVGNDVVRLQRLIDDAARSRDDRREGGEEAEPDRNSRDDRAGDEIVLDTHFVSP
jgi:hypothetical protein